MPGRLKIKVLLPAVLVAAGIVIAYYPTLETLVRQWLASDDYSYGILILPIAIYLAWQRRGRLKQAEVRTDWRALPVLFLAMLLFIAGELGAELFTVRLSLIVLFTGSVWFLYGPRVIGVLRFPLAFLFLMLPLPGMLYRNITFPLQLLSTKLSVALLQLLGVSVYREGNVIDMGFAQFQVVEACNGLRYILPLLVLGVLVAFTGRKALWKRLVLVAATLPFAIFSNILRIAGTGIISMYWGVEAAQGFFHSFSGFAVFGVCLALFGLLNYGLRFLPGSAELPTPEHNAARESTPHSTSARFTFPLGQLVLTIALIAFAPQGAAFFGKVPPRPLKQPLEAFPMQFEGYAGAASKMDPLIWESVGGQSYVLIDYRKPDQLPIDFYAAYYEYQQKAGDFIHSPKLCLPGAGWYIEQSRTRRIALDEPVEGVGANLSFNELIINKNTARQLVYYWYQGRGRNFTDEYIAKFFMVWDGIWRRRTDGALVRLVMPIPDADTAEYRRTLDAFAQFVSRQLSRHLP